MVLKFPDSYPQTHLTASYTPLWDEWADTLSPIVETVGQRYGFDEFETSKIMLTSLRAHNEVPPHLDSNPSSVVPHKVHVPLVTSPEVEFIVEDQRYHLPVGRAFELNNLVMHSVENASDIDRVHFIFEIYATGVAPLPS